MGRGGKTSVVARALFGLSLATLTTGLWPRAAPSSTSVSWSLTWMVGAEPQVRLPSVGLATFEDPTNPTLGPQPTFPHPNVGTPEGPALPVREPIVVAPVTSALGSVVTGSEAVKGGVLVTVYSGGSVVGSAMVSGVATYQLSWSAAVEDVYVSAGSVPASAPVLSGDPVLVAPTGGVTPVASLTPGTFGSTCDAQAVAASDALFAELTPALAQAAAGKAGPPVTTPTSAMQGVCAVEFGAPSGLSPTSTWTLSAQLAAHVTATATVTLQSFTVTVDGVTIDVPGGTTVGVQPELPSSWVLGPATWLAARVATVEALPVGPVVSGG